MFDAIKIFFSWVAGLILTYLQPVFNPVIVLAYIFVLDVIFGIVCDLAVNNDRLRLRKLLVSVVFLTMYLLIVVSTFGIGKAMGDEEEVFVIVKSITYTFLYFYSANILRNMHFIIPQSKAIAFLNWFIGLQVIKYLPVLAEWLHLKKKTEGDNNEAV